MSEEEELRLLGIDPAFLATLEEVVVVGEKKQISGDGERRIFNVKSNVAATGGTAGDLLSAVPSVTVGADGDISLRGKSDVLLYIDGKEMGMTAENRAQYLRQIPAANVESIEVMTTPGASHSTEGTAGIINIRLREDHRHGYFGSAELTADSRGTTGLNLDINVSEGKFESFAALGLKSAHIPSGMKSFREYEEGYSLASCGRGKDHDNSAFLRFGSKFRPDHANVFQLSAIGMLGGKRSHSVTRHYSDIPGQWTYDLNRSHGSGNNRGLNVLGFYRHEFGEGHRLDASISYNIWRGVNRDRFSDFEEWKGVAVEDDILQSQRQDVKISNWEASLDYEVPLAGWLSLEAGYKGNFNREDSPAAYWEELPGGEMRPLDDLYNRFRYNTDINALYLNFSGVAGAFSYSAGLRGEVWSIRTLSLGYDGVPDVPEFRKNSLALFPSASFGWKFLGSNSLRLSYSRRIHRPYGPQLNTFENISDPSSVHLGNPTILPEYSNAAEMTYTKEWNDHTLSAAGYVRVNNDMISHVSFLAPMAANPEVNTMYYGHANVGNLVDAGLELMSRNKLFHVLTLTTTLNLYNSHLKAWSADYPLHGADYPIYGARQNRFVWDVRMMASVSLPWQMTLQATGRYTSRRVMPQGTLEPNWELEAGVRKTAGPWTISLICKDILNSKAEHNILYGNGYTQSISKWTEGRALRLGITYTFGHTHRHDHDGDSHDGHDHEQNVNTGGYGAGHTHTH